ncbi:MAG: antibiotic biosynthesis monooxygenase [Gammaproteobacteria bacterium]
MDVTIVHVRVKPDHIDAFIEACKHNHQHSVQEPGNLRFDILQSSDDPTRFVLYEAYQSREDAAAHKQTRHYLTWRETVADWMAEPRQGVAYNGLYPALD